MEKKERADIVTDKFDLQLATDSTLGWNDQTIMSCCCWSLNDHKDDSSNQYCQEILRRYEKKIRKKKM
jgi:hypothetical protein